jgi:pimeloyl-ACP methyl ester carboxylesterase
MRTLYLLLCALAVLPAAGLMYQAVGKRRDRKRMPPPGRLVDVNGTRMHVLDQGTGVSVVLEAGIAGTSLGWTLVDKQLAANARVVSYDRAGLGWSEPVARPRTVAHAVAELRELLRAAGVEPPYILVGHSYGGLIVRHYAATHSDQVAGLVLVDPVDPREWFPLSENQARRLGRGVMLSRRGALLARFGVVRLALAILASGQSRLPRLIARMSAGRGASVTEKLTGEIRKLPPETWPMIRMHWSDEKCFATMAKYLELLPANVAATQSDRVPEHIPTILLTAPGVEPETAIGLVHRPATRGGHWIQLDEPELVIEAVRELVTSSKKRM